MRLFAPGSTAIVCLALLAAAACSTGSGTVRISSETMRDKIKGGWVGQTVGVCFGGPTEFGWTGTWIGDEVPLEYSAEQLVRYFNNDDLYMDLAFMAVLDSAGLDASSEALALKFANAGFRLWHANQSGRWNILHGIMPPASGYWKNNPHADDIDFQIEADFIGMLCPAMPASALEICDRVGHIMNYGDGYYGGVFVAAMYSHAFVEGDISVVVEKSLESLPVESEYYRTIKDVLTWWRQYPGDWQRCWFEVQKKWANDRGCPECALLPGNIDAKLNGAYIAIGLLYGGGDFGRTLDISTRCGQDSDCNPSNAAGILGTMIGFSNIPEEWLVGLDQIENEKFAYCDYSLNEAYEVTYRLAGEIVTRGGGSVGESTWIIEREKPQRPPLEVAFEGLTPTARHSLTNSGDSLYTLAFEGRAFVVNGFVHWEGGECECEVYVDDKLIEQVTLPSDARIWRIPLFWNYDLEPGSHELVIRQVGGEGKMVMKEALIYE
ncbi:MAG: ADP-ribosylglycohydrolase family protein [Candidatus Glassbacteria bacterium]|nr:ADP-ribosylglycohydrolase family protein [Candidatus Glassbacteria bacterium]